MDAFLALFHRYGYIYKPLSGGSWFSAQEQWKLTDTEILKAVACVHPKHILGARAGRASKYAVIDIDAGSRYHNSRELQKITEILGDAGLPNSVLYRSSDSGGWHLYLFFDEPISSSDLRRQLVTLFKLKGFEIAKGTLEIFPHTSDTSLGQGLRLPLQHGFAWLNSVTLGVSEERADLSPQEALSAFIKDFADNAHTRHEFHRFKCYVDELQARKEAVENEVSGGTTNRDKSNHMLPDNKAQLKLAPIIPIVRRKSVAEQGEAAHAVLDAFGHFPPGMILDRWVAGRAFYEDGLTGPSQRAEAIVSLSHYLFYGDPQNKVRPLGYGYEDEREWAISRILRDKHNECSDDINNDRPDAFEQAKRAANWVPDHMLGESIGKPKKRNRHNPKSWTRHNANQEADARKRIRVAIEELVGSNERFTVRDIRNRAKCSMETLYKHEDIWRPFYDQANSRDYFAAVTPEYNVVVGAGSQEDPPPAQPSLPDMPPGRLAARQIVFELISRGERQEKRKKKDAQKGRSDLDVKWKQEVMAVLPPSVSEATSKSLTAALAVLGSLLMRSPDDEAQGWLQGVISELTGELEARRLRQ